MTAALGAGEGERTGARLGYRSGYYERALVTRVGRIELRVPQDRDGRFSTSVFERYQRSEKALLAALTEMYVQGVSTCKVKKITEELCGHAFSASPISTIVKRLDTQLEAFGEVLPEAAWQRCYVHFLRNALDHMPRKRDDDCLQELRWLYDRRDLDEARRDLAAWLSRWEGKYPKLTTWVEDNIEETFAFYRLPRQHHKHLKSTNMLERVNQEIKRSEEGPSRRWRGVSPTQVIVRAFPSTESCLRLVHALAIEIHEDWLEANRYLNMIHLKESKRERIQKAA